MEQLDLEYARATRDASLLQIAENSEVVCPGWGDTAFSFLCSFSAAKDKGFLAEDVRIAHDQAGNVPAHDNRAWGPILSKAAKQGVIHRVGYGPSLTGHCRPMPIWRSL